MATSIPTWAQAEVANVIPTEEQVQFVGTGRLDVVPPSGLLSVVYWISYIFTNYLALVITALFRNRAVVVVTSRRVVLVSERSWMFPLWVIPMTKRLLVESIERENITTMSTVSARFLWVLSANGLQVECESGTSRIVNGLNKATLADAASIIR